MIWPFNCWPFTRKTEITVEPEPEWTPVSETDEGKLWNQIADGICPECGSTKGFYEGPSGGLSTNIQCVECQYWFNVSPIGTAERIGFK